MESLISQINDLGNAVEKNEMNSHKTLKNPTESGRSRGFTQLVGNGLLVLG